MQSLGVVNGFDEVIDPGAGISDGLEGPRVQFLGFERFHKTLGFGVIVRISGPRHGDGNVMVSEALAVVV